MEFVYVVMPHVMKRKVVRELQPLVLGHLLKQLAHYCVVVEVT
jgi:hypothetical protein